MGLYWLFPPPCDICKIVESLKKDDKYSEATDVMRRHLACNVCRGLVGGNHITVIEAEHDRCAECERAPRQLTTGFGCMTCSRVYEDVNKLAAHVKAFHGYTEFVVLPTISQRYEDIPVEGQ